MKTHSVKWNASEQCYMANLFVQKWLIVVFWHLYKLCNIEQLPWNF